MRTPWRVSRWPGLKIAALRLPAGEEDGVANRRPQRRGAPRGVYGIRGGAA